MHKIITSSSLRPVLPVSLLVVEMAGLGAEGVAEVGAVFVLLAFAAAAAITAAVLDDLFKF
jgi:hypothetical protein